MDVVKHVHKPIECLQGRPEILEDAGRRTPGACWECVGKWWSLAWILIRSHLIGEDECSGTGADGDLYVLSVLVR